MKQIEITEMFTEYSTTRAKFYFCAIHNSEIINKNVTCINGLWILVGSEGLQTLVMS